MPAPITWNSTAIAEVTLGRIGAYPGVGFSELRIDAEAHVTEWKTAPYPRVLDLQLEAYLSRDNRDYIGTFRPARPFAFDTHSQRAYVQLALELSRARVEAIERIRNGGGLTIHVLLRASVLMGDRVQTCQARDQVDVEQSAWVKNLEALGAARVILLEVPVPTSADDEYLGDTIKHLREAQDFVALGKYRRAVGHCRQALEALALALPENEQNLNVDPNLLTNASQMDKAQRRRLLHRAAKHFTHPPNHHDQTTKDIDYSRDDAVAMLTIVAGLIRLYAEEP